MMTKIKAENRVRDENQAHFLNKDQTAAIFGITRRTLEHWMKRKFIPFFKVGRTVRFDPEAVHAHLEANYRVAPHGAPANPEEQIDIAVDLGVVPPAAR
jgi:excisionase family DNA binding protein